jgi:hypothetical protein
MPSVDVREFEQSFVIYFGGEFARINAYTLATTLINLADAAKAANAIINPGFEVEVVVEALASGSFKARVRTIYRGAANLFSGDSLKAIVLSVIAAFVYQHTLAPDTNVVVHVNENEVVIEQGDTRIIVPRQVHEAVQQVERSNQFRRGISETMRALNRDPEISSFGFSRDIEDPRPPVEIPRNRFATLSDVLEEEDGNSRELFELADIRILRAILERSRRRWEFVWNGIKISAPVTDQQFYDDFFARRITIAPGDALSVRLRIRQRRDLEIGIFINESYEVVEVIDHIPRAFQDDLEFGSENTV